MAEVQDKNKTKMLELLKADDKIRQN